MRIFLIVLALGALAAAATLLQTSSDPQRGPETPRVAEFVGRETCTECHAEAAAAWTGSHHDLAMQEVDDTTVLGDFDDAEFDHFGMVTRFYRDGGRFMVRTDGPDGELVDYEVTYVFGVEPLQQYLIEFPDGRIQALSICWDTRPEEAGGQRWYHLYDEPIQHDDELHWTGPNQNWNYMCASCHSTDLRRNYDLADDTFATTWSEIDVSCESCHGPASEHVTWAKSEERATGVNRGLLSQLVQPHSWILPPGEVTARRDPPPQRLQEVDICARCHARRGILSEDWSPSFLDHHMPALLEEPNYHPDGQILEEVYVWGSFLQSKMHAAGVVCSDCHEPHGLELRAEGNALCTRCHQATHFDTPTHHRHPLGSPSASCVECHMPQKTYMGVDPRRDHSFRVPRPDLSDQLGTPNTCTGCHDDESNRWAADAILEWRGGKSPPSHFGEIIEAGRRGTLDAPQSLRQLALDTTAPGIMRATALATLATQGDPGSALKAMGDPDPIVRLGALRTLQNAPPEFRVVASNAVRDPVRAVRIEAARVLAGVPRDRLPPGTAPALDSALREYIAARSLNADQPWAHVQLGELFVELGLARDAEDAYLVALRLDPRHVLARANLADLYRATEREDLGEATLRDGLVLVPEAAELAHALGLLCARQQRMDEAIAYLEQAARQRPQNPRFTYVYAVALHSNGQGDRAIEQLEAAHRRHPSDQETLQALISYYQERGDRTGALRHARTLLELAPGTPGLRDLVRQLGG